MTVAAAVHGMGVALVPRLLIANELTAGLLVQACPHVLAAERGYYLVTPEHAADTPALTHFLGWLLAQAAADSAQA
jgi:LysR family glycine cleavage system transcriptional activator